MKRDKRSGNEMVEKKRRKEMIRKKMWRKKYGVTATEYAWRWGMIIKSFYLLYKIYIFCPSILFFFSFTRPRCVEPCHIPEDALLDIL